MPGMTWNPEADQKLLFFIIASNPDIKFSFDAAAKMFSDDGNTCTPRAVQERYKKLKKQSSEAGVNPSGASSPTVDKTVETSPNTPKTAKGTGKRAAPEEDESPSKKRKPTTKTSPKPKKSPKHVKKEELEDEEQEAVATQAPDDMADNEPDKEEEQGAVDGNADETTA